MREAMDQTLGRRTIGVRRDDQLRRGAERDERRAGPHGADPDGAGRRVAASGGHRHAARQAKAIGDGVAQDADRLRAFGEARRHRLIDAARRQRGG